MRERWVAEEGGGGRHRQWMREETVRERWVAEERGGGGLKEIGAERRVERGH